MTGAKGSRGPKGKKRPPAKRPAGAARAQGPAPGGAAAGGAQAAGGPATPGQPTSAPARAARAGGAAQTPARAKETRAQRLEAARRARRRKAVLTRAGIAGAVALVVLVATVVVVKNKNDARADQARLTAGSCRYDTESDRTAPSPNNHVAPASYALDPPAGGNHDPSAAAGGLYDAEGQTPPPDAQLVHSLEHGLVVIWHRPDLDANDLAAVRGVFDDLADDVIVVPRASLTGKVAATSWGRRLRCGEVEPGTLSEFVDLYRNKSPEPGVR